jgi:glutamyl-tRNA reductase
MSQIPATIRDIKNMALDSVFQKEMAQLDPQSKELIEKIIGYMEKKYISVPMKMAKAVLLEAVQNN